MRARWVLPAIFISLTACAKEPPQQVVTDSFCLTAKKRFWSINDSAESIRDAEAWNTAIDKKCGTKRVASK